MDTNGTERKTILVVDDDAMVLSLVTAILKKHGFLVLSATGPVEALHVESEYSDVIDLLLSDITMPVMSGSQLATLLLDHRPEIRVMFMSGYSEGPLLVLNQGWRFLRKPFLGTELLELVDETLHSSVPSQGTEHFDTRH